MATGGGSNPLLFWVRFPDDPGHYGQKCLMANSANTVIPGMMNTILQQSTHRNQQLVTQRQFLQPLDR